MGTIIAAIITGVFGLVSIVLTARVHKSLKTGNGLSAGQVLYKLLEHTQQPASQAHPQTVPVDDPLGVLVNFPPDGERDSS